MMDARSGKPAAAWRRIFFSEKGPGKTPATRLRTGWWAAAAILGGSLIYYGVRVALIWFFHGLFSAWGVHSGNVALAPGWAQLVFTGYDGIKTLIASLVMLAVSKILRRMWIGDARLLPAGPLEKPITVCVITTLVAVFETSVFFLADSLRLAGPVRFSWTVLPWLIGTAVILLSEACFCFRVLYDGVKDRWGKPAAAILAAAVFFYVNRGYAANAACAVNVALLGVLAAALYDRWGLWAAVGFRLGWSVGTGLVFGTSTVSVFRFYAVSEEALTGGNAGIVCGWATTALLLIALAWLLRKSLSRGLAKQNAGKTAA